MKNLARRSFLKLLPATPLAAKVAADEAIATATRITGGFGAHIPYALGGASTNVALDNYGTPSIGPQEVGFPTIKASEYISTFGVPDWLDFELRDSLRHVYALDVDIAAKRFWSMAVKVVTQRQRNYDRAVARMKAAGIGQTKLNALSKLLGITFPWVRFW